MLELNLKVQFIRHDGLKYVSEELGFFEHLELPKISLKIVWRSHCKIFEEYTLRLLYSVYKSSK